MIFDPHVIRAEAAIASTSPNDMYTVGEVKAEPSNTAVLGPNPVGVCVTVDPFCAQKSPETVRIGQYSRRTGPPTMVQSLLQTGLVQAGFAGRSENGPSVLLHANQVLEKDSHKSA